MLNSENPEYILIIKSISIFFLVAKRRLAFPNSQVLEIFQVIAFGEYIASI